MEEERAERWPSVTLGVIGVALGGVVLAELVSSLGGDELGEGPAPVLAAVGGVLVAAGLGVLRSGVRTLLRRRRMEPAAERAGRPGPGL